MTTLDNGRKLTTITRLLMFFCLGTAMGVCNPLGYAEGNDGMRKAEVNGTVGVTARPLELSGCAVVDGGVLVVEDELIGGVLFMAGTGGKTVTPTLVKLERKKKERAPFAKANKLFPVQDFEDIATDRHETVYLIGSHQGKGGERRPDREFLIQAAWDKKSGELKVRNEQYSLLAQIAPALRGLGCEIGLTDTEVDEAVNVEGLAWHEGQLFVGLRSPRTPQGEAIVLKGLATEVLNAGPSFNWEAIPLALGGGGIRGMDWDPVTEKLLVLSGPSQDGDSSAAALWHCESDGSGLASILAFDPAITQQGPEGVCRLAPVDGGALLVALDGDGKGSGGAFIRVNW